MKLNLLVVTVLGLAGCAKTSDLGHLEDEAQDVADRYRPRIDELNKRLTRLMARDRALPEDLTGHPLASRRLFDARAMLEQLDNQVKLAKNAITSASKTGPLEVVKLTDEMSERLHDGVIRVNDEIDMVTGWIALAEAQPRTVAPPAPDTTPTRD